MYCGVLASELNLSYLLKVAHHFARAPPPVVLFACARLAVLQVDGRGAKALENDVRLPAVVKTGSGSVCRKAVKYHVM